MPLLSRENRFGMIKRVNNDQPNCGVNVKGSEGTCLALDFHGTMVIFVKRLIIPFLPTTVRSSLDYYKLVPLL